MEHAKRSRPDARRSFDPAGPCCLGVHLWRSGAETPLQPELRVSQFRSGARESYNWCAQLLPLVHKDLPCNCWMHLKCATTIAAKLPSAAANQLVQDMHKGRQRASPRSASSQRAQCGARTATGALHLRVTTFFDFLRQATCRHIRIVSQEVHICKVIRALLCTAHRMDACSHRSLSEVHMRIRAQPAHDALLG